jgi:hypothetical protein
LACAGLRLRETSSQYKEKLRAETGYSDTGPRKKEPHRPGEEGGESGERDLGTTGPRRSATQAACSLEGVAEAGLASDLPVLARKADEALAACADQLVELLWWSWRTAAPETREPLPGVGGRQ